MRCQRILFPRAAHTPQPIQWLSDNGSAYRAHETIDFAIRLGLAPCFTPVRSPQSNGMSEAFVKTFKRDYGISMIALAPARSCHSYPGGSRTTTKTTPTKPCS